MPKGWILFSYKTPTTPSSLRVRVWRNLKTLGVHYLQQSVCLCPLTDDCYRKLQKLSVLIKENGGEVSLLEVEKLASHSEEEIILEFNNERELEYKEFLEGATDFLNEIKDETTKHNFSFREIEENEVELQRLKRWLTKIVKRDFFYCQTKDKALLTFDDCQRTVDHFTEQVYKNEGLDEKEES